MTGPARAGGEPARTSPAARRPPRRLQVIALLAGILTALLLAEAALRILDLAHVRPGSPWFAGGNHPRFLFEPDPATEYRLRPGFSGREIARSGEFDVAVAIDDRGMRAVAGASDEPPVVIAVGDSLTFGEGVEAGETFSVLLERATGLRVWNAGVPGYDSHKMRLRLEELLASTHPRLVLVSLMPLWDSERLEDSFVYKDGYIVASSWSDRLHLVGGNLWSESVSLPVIGPLSAHLKARSRLVRLALPALNRVSQARRAHPRGTAGRGETARAPTVVEATARELAVASVHAAASGAKLLAVLLDSRGHRYRRARERLETALTEKRVEYVALDRLLHDTGWKALRHPIDSHWNRDGHRAVADALAPLVVTRARPAVVPAERPPQRPPRDPA